MAKLSHFKLIKLTMFIFYQIKGLSAFEPTIVERAVQTLLICKERNKIEKEIKTKDCGHLSCNFHMCCGSGLKLIE